MQQGKITGYIKGSLHKQGTAKGGGGQTIMLRSSNIKSNLSDLLIT